MSSIPKLTLQLIQLLQRLGGGPARPSSPPKPSKPTPQAAQQSPVYNPVHVVRDSLTRLLQAQKVWFICLMSLPLDLYPLLSPIEVNQIVFSENFFNQTLLIALTTLLLTGNYEYLHRALLAFRRIAHTHSVAVFVVAVISTAGIVGYTLWNVLTKTRAGIVPFVVLVLMILGGLPSFVSTRKKNREHLKRLKQSRVYWIEQFNQNLFLLRILPYLVVRCLTFVAAINASVWDKGWQYYAPFAALALIYLSLSYPRKGDFFTNCRKCRKATSRIFSEFHGCPTCEREAFRPVPGGLKSMLHKSPLTDAPFDFNKSKAKQAPHPTRDVKSGRSTRRKK
jgi:hypothetical protein